MTGILFFNPIFDCNAILTNPVESVPASDGMSADRDKVLSGTVTVSKRSTENAFAIVKVPAGGPVLRVLMAALAVCESRYAAP